MTVYQAAEGKYKIGLIGYGAIGKVVATAIKEGHAGNCELVAVLRQNTGESRPDISVSTDTEAFFLNNYDLIVEAAGHEAVKSLARRCLELPADLLLTSIGVLSDDALQSSLINSASVSGSRMLLASGALPAIDWMSAAARGSECEVTITQEKPLASWCGTPAEKLIDKTLTAHAQCFFEGSARESASRFPRSSNITAMLALSTVGLDACQVRLVSDPESVKMRTLIDFSSSLGDLNVVWHGFPSIVNPRTSIDVAETVIKAIRNLTSTIVVGV